VNVAARNMMKREIERKASMERLGSYEEIPLDELNHRDGQTSPRPPEKKKKKGLLAGTIRGAKEKVENATGFILPGKHDIEDTVGLITHSDRGKNRAPVEQDTFDFI